MIHYKCQAFFIRFESVAKVYILFTSQIKLVLRLKTYDLEILLLHSIINTADNILNSRSSV